MTETTRVRTAAAGVRLTLSAILCLTVAACSMPGGGNGPATAQAPAPPPADAQARTVPVPISPGDRSRIARPDPATSADPTPQPSSDITALIGRNEETVLSRLGEPALRQEEPPARVWQYAGRSCAVDLVFFFDMESGEHRLALFRPAGASAPARDGRPAGENRCRNATLAQIDQRP